MNRITEILVPSETLGPYILRLERLYAAMDRVYRNASRHYGFVCRGCEESCCRTRFYHFTLTEYLYLYEGYRTLAPSLRCAVHQKAVHYTKQMEIDSDTAMPLREYCPLNTEGPCLLYPWRPMICRLHGVPHEIHTPGRPISYGAGCAALVRTCGNKPYIPFDRTPFYRELADHEQALRKEIGINHGIRMTVAMMILDYEISFPKRRR